MRRDILRIIAAALGMVMLSGCEAGNVPAETAGPTAQAPGSVNVYLHGRAEVDLGVSSR